ncbi:tripartite tricarboxylate transporter permease [Pseudomonadota bacterium]
MMWDSFLQGIDLALRWDTFGMMCVGLMLGMFVGALPGFTTVMAMALVLPISFFLDPLVGIPFLIGVYKGGIYGGSIPAILISVPGTGAAIATTFDGPKLTQKGEGRKALEIALYSSVFGDLSSDIITLFLIVPISIIALLIGPPELTAIIVLALIIVASASTGSMVKGLVMGFVGLLLSMVGQDPFEFISRFTFGSEQLKSGIPLLPMMIGLFAIPEILAVIERAGKDYVTKTASLKNAGERLRFHEFRRCFKTICRSTIIGTCMGAVPGVGQPIAAFAGYGAAKNASDHPETFGKGELEGVAAAEAANNAVNGPTLVPLLTLGIPGDKITAILLGAFVAHGLRPGPTLMQEHGATVFAIMVAMILANVIFLILAYVSIPLFARIVTMRSFYLVPIIVIFAFSGSYVSRSDPFDLQVLVAFGIFGYFARKLEFDVAPLVMAFILGQILEYTFGQTINMADGSLITYLLTDRLSAGVIFALVPVVLVVMGTRARKRRIRQNKKTIPIGEDAA